MPDETKPPASSPPEGEPKPTADKTVPSGGVKATASGSVQSEAKSGEPGSVAPGPPPKPDFVPSPGKPPGAPEPPRGVPPKPDPVPAPPPTSPPLKAGSAPAAAGTP